MILIILFLRELKLISKNQAELIMDTPHETLLKFKSYCDSSKKFGFQGNHGFNI